MPFILSRVSCSVTKEQETALKARLGKAVELIPGMSEAYLLAGFEDNYHFYLRGDDSQPIAYNTRFFIFISRLSTARL